LAINFLEIGLSSHIVEINQVKSERMRCNARQYDSLLQCFYPEPIEFPIMFKVRFHINFVCWQSVIRTATGMLI
jgi:hypothetical protein